MSNFAPEFREKIDSVGPVYKVHSCNKQLKYWHVLGLFFLQRTDVLLFHVSRPVTRNKELP